MRFITSLLLALLLIGPAAAADSGQQADFSTVIEIGDAFSSLGPLLGQQAAPGTSTDSDEPAAPLHLTGKLYWTDKFIRLDYDPANGMHESTLVDIENQVTYKLDHLTHTATRIELAGWSQNLASGFNLPEPETLAADWEGFLAVLQQTKGATVNQLAPRQVNGYRCSGVSFVVEAPARDKAKEGAAAGEDAELGDMLDAMMSALGGYSGEVWVADGVTMPISMTLNTELMDYTLDIANIAPVQFKLSKFMVPPGYKVLKLDLEDILDRIPAQHETSQD